MSRFRRLPVLIVLASVALLLCSCQSKSTPASTISTFKETVVAGTAEDFMLVRHLVIRGSDYGIGKKIGEVAREFGVRMAPSADSLRNKVQREYVKNNYPILYERMRGVADAFGLDINDAHYDFSSLSQYPSRGPGCSAVFYPGAFTENGHSILSRNYDFTTGDFQGRRTQSDELPAMARPYIFELYPDRGYASLSICAFDLLGGVLDGINAEGLAVAILADGGPVAEFGGNQAARVGMHELLSMRYLLDNCKDVDEAKEALLYLKHFYTFIPCHYIICDKSGKSFVFEFSPQRNGVAIVDGKGPQCVTNHLLSDYRSIEELREVANTDSYERYGKLYAAVKDKRKFGLDEIKTINSNVAATETVLEHLVYAPGRTLWHALYDLDEKSISVRFYMRDRVDPSDNTKRMAEYTEYLTFKLMTEK